MRILEFSDPHRRKHFDFFRQMDQPHFSLCANVDIAPFLEAVRQLKRPFTPAMVYLLSRTTNDIPAFRQRLRGDQAVEHERISPSFTVTTDVSDTFSFCTVPYQASPGAFIVAAQAAMERMRTHPSFEDEEGRDDYIFMSAIPWVSFTGITHAMHYSPVDAVPRISWGKYFVQGPQVMMPLSVQAHHAFVDGRHMGAFFMGLQDYLDRAGEILGEKM